MKRKYVFYMGKQLIAAASLLFLASCTVKTNFGDYIQSKADTEIRSGEVQVFDASEITMYNASFLGQIDTEFCQNNRFGELPPSSKLHRILKAKTQKLGGNGIVYGQCETRKDYQGCNTFMSCDALAYSIKM